MADIAIARNAEAQRLGGVGAEAHSEPRRQPEQQRKRRPRPRSPEVAIALGAAVSLSYEIGADGQPLVRVVDHERGETVALLSPEELRSLTADTGLPPGSLVRLSS